MLGFSIGGFVAQEITLAAPQFVRRLILVGTGPRGRRAWRRVRRKHPDFQSESIDEPDHLWLSVVFTQSPASQAAGRAFLKRFRLRTKDRDPEVNYVVPLMQRAAIAENGPR